MISSPRRSLAAASSLALAGLVLGAAPATSASTSADDLTWQAITFGQSTDLNFSANVLPDKVGVNYADPDVPGTAEGEIFMESRGGKIAPGHDGLTFYHVDLDPNEHNFVLSADVTVHQLGPETSAGPNGQEGAGLMVRDLNGGARQDPMLPGFEEVPAASNMASTSMFRNGPVALTRTGVTEPWGNVGSERLVKALVPGTSSDDYLDQPVHMTLERTDTDFVMTAEVDGTESSSSLEGADWVQDIDPDNMTVGLYASRNVAVTFSDVELTLSDAHTVPRPPAPEPVTPVRFDVTSPEHYGAPVYPFGARATYDGTLDVMVDGEPVLEQADVTADEDFAKTLDLAVGGNDVTATYTPTDPDAPSTEPVTRTLAVTVRELAAGDTLTVAPYGDPSGDGSSEEPLDVQTAIDFALPGQTVELSEGTYQPSSTLTIPEAYSGTADAPKTLTAASGADVTIDGRDALAQDVRLDADNWRVSGLHLVHAAQNGMRMSGSSNVISHMEFAFNGNTGFQMTGGGDRDEWPAGNVVEYSESHDNRDSSDINADGFAAKLGVGPDNVFRSNISHHNIDDGWDLYNRTNEGANFPITLEDNISYSNGKLSDGYREDGSSGSGFKLGGEGLPVAHVVRHNLAFDNNMDGFTDNFNPGRLELTGNTSVDNKRFNYIFRINPYFTSDEQGVFRDNLSLRTDDPGEDGRDWVSGVVDATNFFFDGSRSESSDGTFVVPKRDLVSLKAPASYARHDDGTIARGDFARPTFRSVLVDAGTDGGYVGALEPAARPGHGADRR